MDGGRERRPHGVGEEVEPAQTLPGRQDGDGGHWPGYELAHGVVHALETFLLEGLGGYVLQGWAGDKALVNFYIIPSPSA